MPELRQLLDRLPRLLLYPVHEHKYQLKLRFLTGGPEAAAKAAAEA